MSLQDDALRLAELDRRIIRDLLEKNVDDFGDADHVELVVGIVTFY